MSTWADVTAYIRTQLRPGVLGNTDVQKILNSILAIINQINAGSIDPEIDAVWKADVTYAADTQPVLWQDQWLVSNTNGNIGNVPISTAGVVHPTWRVIGSSAGSGIRIWTPIVYPNTLEIVFFEGAIYYLNRAVVGNDPFVSVNFATELAGDIWLEFLGGEGGGGSSFSPQIVQSIEEMLNPGTGNPVITLEALNNALSTIDFPVGRRIISTEVIITSATAGLITAQWINGDGIERNLTNDPLTFAGAPSAGNLRWDLVELYDDGTVAVKTGTEGATAVRPTPTADTLTAWEGIWNEAGEVQPSPGGGNTTSVWSNVRFSTQLAADTTGKFAKIWEGNLSRDNNYAIVIAYNDPKNGVSFDGTGAGQLKVSWTCDSSRNIIADTVKILTDADSLAGEFRLVQITGNRAALYHKGSHFWSRIDFRVLFQSSAVRLQDFVNNGAYGSAPSAVATFDSKAKGEKQERASNTILFDQDYIIGNSGARSGNILFDFTGAKLGAETEMRHADASAFTFPTEAILMFKPGDISTTDDNYFLFVLTKKSSPQIVKVFHALEGGV